MRSLLLMFVAAMAVFLAGSGSVKADSYSLVSAVSPAPITSHSGFTISGDLGSGWSGHMGDSYYCSNSVKVMTGIGAHFYYDLYVQDYYSGQWVYNSHATSYVTASRGLNPVWFTGIAGNTDFDDGCSVDVGTDFDSWFHSVQPDGAYVHYVLTGVDYQFTQSAEIYWNGPIDDELQNPPGTVTATPTLWYSL